MPQQLIRNLVFQGGSVKGIAYIGALQALQNYGLDMTKIKRVAGTSAGAITATLLALGCDVSQVEALLEKLDFKAILDDKKGGIPTRKKILKSVGKHEHRKSTFFAKIPTKPIKKVLGYRLHTQSGIFDGEYMRLWIENLIQNQVKTITCGKHNGVYLTFAELHNLTQEYSRFRDLSVIGANKATGAKTVFCYNNADTKDVIISDAIRISMSIPALFKPHSVYHKVNGERCLLVTELGEWVDGGVYDNYPIDCFDKQEYLEHGVLCVSPEDGRCYNPETLGFRLVTKDLKDYLEGRGNPPKNKFSGIFKYLFGVGFDLQEQDYTRYENINRTIHINHQDISMLQFDLGEEDQMKLIEAGRVATQDYLAKHFDEYDETSQNRV